MRQVFAVGILVAAATPAAAQHAAVSRTDLAALMTAEALTSGSTPVTGKQSQLVSNLQAATQTDAGPDLTIPAVRKRIAEGLLGSGFDIWANHPLPAHCVKYPANYLTYLPAVAGVPSQSSWSYLKYVNSYSQHVDNQSFGVAATITYNAFSLGGSHTDASSNGFSSFSSYIDVNKGVIGDVATLSPPIGGPLNALLASDTGRAAAMSKVAGRFSDVCGQAFVSKVEFGEKIVGTLNYQVTLDSSAKSNSTAVSAGVMGILGGSVSSSSSAANLSKIAAISYNVQGGPAQDPDQDKWLSSIQAYGSDGKFAAANQVVFVEVTSYAAVPDAVFAGMVDPATNAQGTMLTLRTEYMLNLQELTDTLAAQRAPAVFETPTPDYPVRITALAKYLDDAGAAYHQCAVANTAALAKACVTTAQKVTPPPFYPPLALK